MKDKNTKEIEDMQKVISDLSKQLDKNTQIIGGLVQETTILKANMKTVVKAMQQNQIKYNNTVISYE